MCLPINLHACQSQTLTLTITFLLLEIGGSYLAYVFLMTIPFRLYHEFWTCDLDRDLTSLWNNFNIVHNFCAVKDPSSYFACVYLWN